MNTGQLLYECDMAQCNNITSNSFTGIDGNILILQRQTQTVRASDPRNGIERYSTFKIHYVFSNFKYILF